MKNHTTEYNQNKSNLHVRKLTRQKYFNKESRQKEKYAIFAPMYISIGSLECLSLIH